MNRGVVWPSHLHTTNRKEKVNMTIPTGNSEGMGKKMGANVAIAIYTMSTGPRPFFLAEASDVVNVS